MRPQTLDLSHLLGKGWVTSKEDAKALKAVVKITNAAAALRLGHHPEGPKLDPDGDTLQIGDTLLPVREN